VEFRFPDAMANPYLAYAALLMAGLDGIKNKIHPGEAMDKNLYDLPPAELAAVPTVCGSLREALDCWPLTTTSCSMAACSPRTRSKPISNSSGPKCCAGKPRRRPSSSTCTTARK
jgi:hypothetical protein